MMSLSNPKIRMVVHILQIHKHIHLNQNHVRHLNYMPMLKKDTPHSNCSNLCLFGSALSHSSFYRQRSLYDLINLSGQKRLIQITKPVDKEKKAVLKKEYTEFNEKEFIANIDHVLMYPSEYRKKDFFKAQDLKASQIAINWFRKLDIESPTDSEWVELKTSIQSLTRVSWDIYTMKRVRGNLKHAQVLMSYFESTGTNLNRVLLSLYVEILGTNSNGDIEIEDKTKMYFEKVVSENSIIDPPTANNLLRGITHTRHYLESKKILDMALNLYPADVSNLELHLVEACIKNNNVKLADSIMNKQKWATSIQGTKDAWNWRYIACLDSCLKSGNEQGMLKLTDVFRENMVYFTEDQKERICETFKKRQPGQWSLSTSFIHRKEKDCNNCSMVMEKLAVSDTEFSELQDKFMKQVIVTDNIYNRSSPLELKQFTRFIRETSPYDVVIDGLNILCLHSALGLSKIIDQYTNQGLRVLTVGNYIPPFKKFTELRKKLASTREASKNVGNSYIFSTKTTKADDVFMLYAALCSSKHCQIITHDKLRQHKFLMEPGLRKVFQRWLASVHVCDKDKRKFNPETIGDVSLGPIRDSGGWHFPLEDWNDESPYGENTVLCARQNSPSNQHLSPSSVQKSSKQPKATKVKHLQNYKLEDKADNQTRQVLELRETLITKSPTSVKESSTPHKATKVKNVQKDNAENKTPHFLDALFDKAKH